MAVLRIHTYPDPVLKKKAKPVKVMDDEIRRLAADMVETMYAAPGVGLAANQVGRLHRVAVIDITPADAPRNPIILINPEIIASDGKCVNEEGCLSVPGYKDEIKRFEKVTVRAMDIDGKSRELSGEGLLAIAFQHEIDHLDGILFIDRLSTLKRSLVRRKLAKARENYGTGT
jgi:peptide deformylase